MVFINIISLSYHPMVFRQSKWRLNLLRLLFVTLSDFALSWWQVQHTQEIRRASNSIQTKLSEISKGGQIVCKFPKKVEKSVEFPKSELSIQNVWQVETKSLVRFLNIFLYLESLSSFPETVPFVTWNLRKFKPFFFCHGFKSTLHLWLKMLCCFKIYFNALRITRT